MLRSKRGFLVFASGRMLGFFLIAPIAIAALFFFGSYLVIAQVTQTFSTIIARPIIATSTTILFSLKPIDVLPSGTSLVFDLPAAYDVPGTVTPADGALTIGGMTKTLGAIAGAGTYGYSISGDSITLTVASDETVSAGATIELLVGRELGIVTPNAYGTSLFAVRFLSPLAQVLGTTQAVTVIVPPIGVSASVSSTNPIIRILNLRPELTSTSLNAQYLANFFVTVRYAAGFGSDGTANNRTVYRDQTTHEADADGNLATPITLIGASDGTFDVYIKTSQHLSRATREILLAGGTSTDVDYSTTTLYLLGGDINGDGTVPDTFGDDVANAVDISLLTSALDGVDPSGVSVRANLNHDEVVNSIDLSILLKNLDAEGDLRN